MMPKILYPFTFLFILKVNFFCTEHKEVKKDSIVVVKPDSTALVTNVPVVEDMPAVKKGPFDSIVAIDKETSIRIISIEKKCKPQNLEDKYTKRYQQWTLDTSDIIKIIRHSEPTHFMEIDAAYNTLACEVSGDVMIDNKPFRYDVNAGSYLYLHNKDTSYILVCDSKECRNLFLSHYDIGEY